MGRSAAQAAQVFHNSKAFESAGAFALEMEVVPAQVAAEITRRVSILTISLGSGTGFGFNPLRFRSRWRLSRACVASPGKS